MKSLQWYKEEALKAGNNARRLSELMTMMEKQFNIPVIKSEDWDQEHKDIISLYRQLSKRRDLE